MIKKDLINSMFSRLFFLSQKWVFTIFIELPHKKWYTKFMRTLSYFTYIFLRSESANLNLKINQHNTVNAFFCSTAKRKYLVYNIGAYSLYNWCKIQTNPSNKTWGKKSIQNKTHTQLKRKIERFRGCFGNGLKRKNFSKWFLFS